MLQSFLGPEGLSLEALFEPIRLIALQPLVTAPLLLLLLKRPTEVQQLLPTCLGRAGDVPALTTLAKYLLTIGTLRKINAWLTRWTLNNWCSDRTWDWRKEIVLVTGGAGGLGEMIARKLAKKSIKVIVLDIANPKEPLPSNVWFYKVDVTSSEELKSVGDKMRKEVGHPTVLINNAGIATMKNILDESDKEVQRTFNVNVVSQFALVKEFGPSMIEKNHGHVITVASLASFVTYPSNTSYSASKAATLSFHEGLTGELKHRYNAPRVRTTIVHPTWIQTPLIEMLSARKSFNTHTVQPATVANAIVNQVLLGESSQLIITGRYGWVASIRGFPGWLQKGIRNVGSELLRY